MGLQDNRKCTITRPTPILNDIFQCKVIAHLNIWWHEGWGWILARTMWTQKLRQRLCCSQNQKGYKNKSDHELCTVPTAERDKEKGEYEAQKERVEQMPGRGVVDGWRGGGWKEMLWSAMAAWIKKCRIFTFSLSSLTSKVPRLAGLSTRKRLRRFSQSVDM